MKKIIVGLLSVAMVFAAHSVFASSAWNGASNDCNTVSIINATTNQGYVNPCWPLSSVQASAGDVINVRVYYHNTGSQTANNTRITLNAPVGNASTSMSFSGSITSDQGNLSFGPVNAQLSTSQSLTFLSAKWYTNNTSETLTSFPNGQSGAEILNGGVSIGSIAPGWSSQGSIVVAFRVSSTVVQQTCQDPSATNYGGALPCTYPQAQVCQDPSATNYHGALPCAYPQLCQDSSATNYHGALPCTYPQLCQDSTATNYHGALPCTYPQLCQDSSATNYHGALPCQYPQQLCRHISATNYLGALPCQYPIQQICRDITATNYGSIGSCIYPQQQICRDVSASNYLSPGACYYPQQQQLCRDISATNYLGTLPCIFYTQPIYSNYCTISSFTANGSSGNITVASGSPLTLSWSTYGCTNVSITGLNNVAVSGSQTVYPTYSTNYVLTAYSQNGQLQTQTLYVNVNSQIVTPIYNACAVTTVATNVTTNSAQLNGIISGGSGSTSTYFEYGTTTNLGSQTTAQYVSNGSQVTQFLGGLLPNTIYYFRLDSNCNNGGLSQGALQFFSTLGNTVVTGGTTIVRRPVIVQGTTVIGTSSPIQLSITDLYQSIGVGDTIDYTVTYKNIGSTVLHNAILQVVAPKGIVFTNASRGTYSADTNTLTVELEDLYPNAPPGTVQIQGRVDSIPENTAQIVTTAILVYTSPSGAQENAIAYVLNQPKVLLNNNNLGAAAFFLGIFPGTLLGWLILLIIILLIILLARRYYDRPVVVTHMSSVPPPPPAAH